MHISWDPDWDCPVGSHFELFSVPMAEFSLRWFPGNPQHCVAGAPRDVPATRTFGPRGHPRAARTA
eukprot:1067898-Prymnesium_polylepis.1